MEDKLKTINESAARFQWMHDNCELTENNITSMNALLSTIIRECHSLITECVYYTQESRERYNEQK